MLRLYKKYSEEIKKSVKIGVILLLTRLSQTTAEEWINTTVYNKIRDKHLTSHKD